MVTRIEWAEVIQFDGDSIQLALHRRKEEEKFVFYVSLSRELKRRNRFRFQHIAFDSHGFWPDQRQNEYKKKGIVKWRQRSTLVEFHIVSRWLLLFCSHPLNIKKNYRKKSTLIRRNPDANGYQVKCMSTLSERFFSPEAIRYIINAMERENQRTRKTQPCDSISRMDDDYCPRGQWVGKTLWLSERKNRRAWRW